MTNQSHDSFISNVLPYEEVSDISDFETNSLNNNPNTIRYSRFDGRPYRLLESYPGRRKRFYLDDPPVVNDNNDHLLYSDERSKEIRPNDDLNNIATDRKGFIIRINSYVRAYNSGVGSAALDGTVERIQREIGGTRVYFRHNQGRLYRRSSKNLKVLVNRSPFPGRAKCLESQYQDVVGTKLFIDDVVMLLNDGKVGKRNNTARVIGFGPNDTVRFIIDGTRKEGWRISHNLWKNLH